MARGMAHYAWVTGVLGAVVSILLPVTVFAILRGSVDYPWDVVGCTRTTRAHWGEMSLLVTYSHSSLLFLIGLSAGSRRPLFVSSLLLCVVVGVSLLSSWHLFATPGETALGSFATWQAGQLLDNLRDPLRGGLLQEASLPHVLLALCSGLLVKLALTSARSLRAIAIAFSAFGSGCVLWWAVAYLARFDESIGSLMLPGLIGNHLAARVASIGWAVLPLYGLAAGYAGTTGGLRRLAVTGILTYLAVLLAMTAWGWHPALYHPARAQFLIVLLSNGLADSIALGLASVALAWAAVDVVREQP